MPIQFGGGLNWTHPLLQQINRQGENIMYADQAQRANEQNAMQRQLFNVQMLDRLTGLQEKNALRQSLMGAGDSTDLEKVGLQLIKSGNPAGLDLIMKARELNARGGYSLKPGEKRFDASGREIATGGPEPLKDEYSRAAGRQLSLDELVEQKRKVAAATAPNISVDVNKKGMTAISEKMGEDLIKERVKVEAALASMSHLDEAERLLKRGVITGKGAKFLTEFGAALSAIGIKQFDEPVANTQAFVGTMGRQVGENIKMFGSGTGLSDADRSYAEKMAGGQVELTEAAIRKIIDINRRQASWIYKQYNAKAEQAMKRPGASELPYDLRINLPQRSTEMPVANQVFKTADEVKAAFDSGKLSESDALTILSNQFGMK